MPPTTTKKFTLVAFATAWGPKFGGINAFNTDLLQAIAAAHWQWLNVICVVAACDDAEIKTARAQDLVTLISLGVSTGAMGPEHAPLVASKLGTPDSAHTVWLGHDRITGAIANAMAAEHGGRSALIHHMSYDHYEPFAENSQTAAEKRHLQEKLFKAATVRMAVGPLLRDALADMLDVTSADIPMLVPGLAEIDVKQHKRRFIAFISGRLDVGARKIKQTQLAVAGFAHAVQRCDCTIGLPESLKGAGEPKIMLRGIDMEASSDPGFADAEQELRTFVEEHADRAINLQALPFCHDRQELFNELRTASVCLMPSWHEGFGLVAWEAIAAGVPLILSRKSGVFQLLEKKHFEGWVQALDIKGSHKHPYFTESDKEATAEALIRVASKEDNFRSKAHLLRETLLREYTWRHGADAFVQSLGWQAPNMAPSAAATAAPTSPDNPAPAAPEPKAQPLSLWLDQPQPQWSAHAGLHPSQLLRAEEALIPFAPECEPFLQTQMEWATATAYPIGVRLLTGEGGAGKTRLALELCERLRQQGWYSGFLRHNTLPREITALANELGRAQHSVLIVLDYAETRSQQLLELLAQALTLTNKPKVRLLLLARSSGDWWGQLPGVDPRCESLLDGAATTGPYSVPVLYDALAQRQIAFAQALRAFAKVLQCAAPDIQPDLHAAAYGKPLYLHMAALLALLGERQASVGALPMTLVRHEQRYWHKATGTPSNESSCALLMGLVTLSGPAARFNDLEPLWRAAEGEASQLRPLFKALAPLYPETQGLGGLRPDLLGEALVAQQLLGTHGPAILNAVLSKTVTEAQRLHTLTVLSRLLRYRSDLAPLIGDALVKHFTACAKAIVNVTVQTPSPLPQVAETSFKRLQPSIQLQVAGLLESDFKHDVLPLGGMALLIHRTLSDQAKKRCERGTKPSLKDQAKWAGTLLNLGTAYHRIGDFRNALASTRLSVEKFQRPAQTKPESFEPYWAISLSNYALRLADNGQHAEALNHAKQALDILERLAKTEPERFEAVWATSLSNYAIRLANSDQLAEALKHAKLALDLREKLAQAEPKRFDPDWATSLSNYAISLAENGQHAEALEHAKQALDLRERLAKSQPERFEADWATSLNNYANHLAENGLLAEALKHAKQALDLLEQLARAKPERFEPDRAMSLTNYSSRLGDDGQISEALKQESQALGIYERLALELPVRYQADARGSRLRAALWEWLAEQRDLVLAEDTELTEDLPFSELPNRFCRAVLLSLVAQDRPNALPALNRAWKAWADMPVAQKVSWEPMFLLACSWANHLGGLPAEMAPYRRQLERLRTRRRGRLPAWMLRAAELKGFALE